jgi:hypothetical protein
VCAQKSVKEKETDLVLAERLVLAEIPQTFDLLGHPEPIPVHQLVHPGVERFWGHVVEPIPDFAVKDQVDISKAYTRKLLVNSGDWHMQKCM